MKTNIRTISAIIAGLVFIFSSCKYEDGPGISLRSKKERIANTWEVAKAYEDGQDVTEQYDQFELQMFSDGDARLVALYTFGDLTFEFETDGTWELVNNAEELELDFEDDNADRSYVILRLAEKELWLREKGGEVELQLECK